MFNKRNCSIVGAIVALACSQWTLGAVELPVVADNIAVHFKRLDINKDGFVDMQEVLNLDRNSFDSADSDKDGLLNQHEFGQFLNNIAEVLKKEQELSKEILLHQVVAGGRRPIPAANIWLID